MNYLNIPIVEVAISLVIVWALFAIFCGLFQEFVVQLKGERGKFFKKQLFQQLNDLPNQINWAAIVYSKSQIDLLSREYNNPANSISSRILAESLIESVAKSHLVQMKKAELQVNNTLNLNNFTNQILNDFEIAMNTFAPSDIISLLKIKFENAVTRASGTTNGAEGAIYENLVTDLEKWFDEFGTHSTAWYKSLTKKRIFFLGLLMSVLLNVNSVDLFRYFNSNPEARMAVINYYLENRDSLEKLSNSSSLYSNKLKADSTLFYYSNKMDTLIKDTQIPIGNLKKLKPDKFDYTDSEPINYIIWIFGFIITAFAGSAGAPFWFDLLRKANVKTSKQ